MCVSLSSFLCKSLGSISDAQASVSSFTVEAVPMGKGRSIETNQPPMKSPLRALDEHVCVHACVCPDALLTTWVPRENTKLLVLPDW